MHMVPLVGCAGVQLRGQRPCASVLPQVMPKYPSWSMCRFVSLSARDIRVHFPVATSLTGVSPGLPPDRCAGASLHVSESQLCCRFTFYQLPCPSSQRVFTFWELSLS